MSKLTFNRENALRYQLSLVGFMITKQKNELQSLMQTKQQRLDMRVMLNESPHVWKAMSEVLRPETQMIEMEKHIVFQEQLIKFLEAKQRALELMINDENDPKVSFKMFFGT